MRSLLPAYAEDVDLAAYYAYPEGPYPWVRANMVAGADGGVTLAGRSAGLSSETDKQIFALLRGLADVIVAGAGTVRVEGYGPVRPRRQWRELRAIAGQPPAPPIAVVSRRLDLDLSGRLFTAPEAGTIVLTAQSAPAERRREVAKHADVVIAGGDWVDLGAAVDALAERGHRRILCEGGPQLLAQVAAAGRLDELCLTVSPLLAAGDAPRILNGPELAQPARLRLAHLLEDEDFLFMRYTRDTQYG